MGKQRIVIKRSIKESQLFDQMPSRRGDFWNLLLCHGGYLVDMVLVLTTIDGCTQPLDAYHWYPRSLLKTLLMVSGIVLAHVY